MAKSCAEMMRLFFHVIPAFCSQEAKKVAACEHCANHMHVAKQDRIRQAAAALLSSGGMQGVTCNVLRESSAGCQNA